MPGEERDLVISPDGCYLFGADSTNDQILPWAIDPADGSVTAVDRLPGTPSVHDGFATSVNPDTLAIHPSGRQLYVGVNDGTLTHDIDTSTGFVSEFNPVVDVPVGPTNPEQIVIYRVQ